MTEKREETRRQAYRSISIPAPLLEEVEKLVRELGYWPTKTAFIREACLEKMERHRRELKRRKR